MKKLFNSCSLLVGLIFVLISVLDNRKTINGSTEKTVGIVRQVKPGSIYDGDTLRVIGKNEELKIRLCGIDAPELKMPLGIESRDYLRSLITKSNGTVRVLPIEKDRYGRTVAELWIPIKPNFEQEIHINTAMIKGGMAYHYQQYSGSCENATYLNWAEKIARGKKLGVWNGSHQRPWDYRKTNK